MKKTVSNLFLLGILFFTEINESTAQNSSYSKKQVNIQAGVGFISTLTDVDDYGIGFEGKLISPPISASVEVGVTDKVSVALYGGVAQSDIYYQDLAQRVRLGRIRHTLIGIRGLYHVELVKKLDTYAGVLLAYNIQKIDQTIDESSGKENQLAYTFFAGGRYQFAKVAGIFLELGYGVSVISVGLNFSFNR